MCSYISQPCFAPHAYSSTPGLPYRGSRPARCACAAHLRLTLTLKCTTRMWIRSLCPGHGSSSRRHSKNRSVLVLLIICPPRVPSPVDARKTDRLTAINPHARTRLVCCSLVPRSGRQTFNAQLQVTCAPPLIASSSFPISPLFPLPPMHAPS